MERESTLHPLSVKSGTLKMSYGREREKPPYSKYTQHCRGLTSAYVLSPTQNGSSWSTPLGGAKWSGN